MNENSAEGVCYYDGTLPANGIYYDGDWLSKGKEPGCLFAATIVGILTVLMVLLCH